MFEWKERETKVLISACFLPYIALQNLLTFSFQFFTRLAAVFAEEVGEFCTIIGHI